MFLPYCWYAAILHHDAVIVEYIEDKQERNRSGAERDTHNEV